jgi:DNA (cytosine-5)-methyltransferase 1
VGIIGATANGDNNVDTTKAITHVSLCAGYGGIDLGLKRAIPTLRTIAFSEIEAFACANLVAKMEAGLLDPAPIWTDLKTFPWSEFHGRVDILSGGYPCQPFSAAGKRLGAEDPRHLWPYIRTGIDALRPRVCFFENVEGHITLGLRDVLCDLGELGYRTTFGIFSASEVGAVHQRKRVFILAYATDDGCAAAQRSAGAGQSEDCGWLQQLARVGASSGVIQNGWPGRPGELQWSWEPPRIVGDAESRASVVEGSIKSEKRAGFAAASPERSSLADAERQLRPGRIERPGRRIGQPEETACDAAEARGECNGLRQTQPSLGRDADGPTHRLDHAVLHVSTDNRTDELRLLGNGVVPATAERAFRVLVGELMEVQP